MANSVKRPVIHARKLFQRRTVDSHGLHTGTMSRNVGTDTLRRKSLKDIVRHFTPAWFAVTMGTGSIAILFHNFPYATDSSVMRAFTLVFFFFNLALYILFSAVSAARYILFPGIWSRMIRHPVQSLYIGTFPMGATTLINIASADIFETYGFGGKPFIYTVWACWWINVVISFTCCFGMMHVM
ncbi:hypothetical protein AZE42_01982 [Rhizopogon vesiculosus]|uniref:C4-dicarboxylate transporter/malic acid transport protein n=1 Tax=Rhizopogon vesiculosus TaxID=180088 RepID=A0A1J8R9E3_9AGAM|nr:hypothetical protein AZE42_01982 [Rhizopogon vesiculosus]